MAGRRVDKMADLWVCLRADSTADKKDVGLAGRWVGLKVELKVLWMVE